MPSYYNTQTIQNMLEKVRQRKAGETTPRPYMQAPSFTEMTPQELEFKPPSTSTYEELQGQVARSDEEASRLSTVKAQNTYNYQQMVEAQRQRKQAQQALKDAQRRAEQAQAAAQAAQQGAQGAMQGFGGVGGPAITTNQPGWGKDRVPEVSDIKNLNPDAPIVNVSSHGRSFNINSQVAPIFLAFLDDLWKTGYRFKSIGGHVERNIAGTNTPSLHSHGFAIDIDPSRNPIYYNSEGGKYALPPRVGALAAKYGLSWGGNWRNTKDYMHFSVPYGGTK